MGAVILGTGHYLPEWALTNDDLEAMDLGFDRKRAGESLDEWALKRVGIRVRHRVRPGEGCADLATPAARLALEDAGLTAEDVQLLVLSTYTSDYRIPSTASIVQGQLGSDMKFFQLDAACAGFVDSFITAAALLEFMNAERALVISADTHSMYFGPKDFMGWTIFGDGAGAAVIGRQPDSNYGIQSHVTSGDGSIGSWTRVPGGGSKEPISEKVAADGRMYGEWDHESIYPFAVDRMVEDSQAVMEAAGWSADEVDRFVPHQAGLNIIRDVAQRINQPLDKFSIVIDHTGNTSGASIPIALDEENKAGVFKDGDKIVMAAIGGGMSWGALTLVWQE